MAENGPLVCRVCQGHHFTIKYEATYEYSYRIDENAPGWKNTDEFLPFLYDTREQKDARQYLQCEGCGTQYPCYFNQWDREIGVKALEDAIQAAGPVPES
ncbi:hypothetical protein EDC14_104020 [Hydrogenispora ethanolica]|uniref:Uncharacterized protein n=1 Tax=Hydrogenispora ethanolica TaxID=1082276 RepID=A0A4R1R0K2_HYDET|nr:hypothetical protein [Hydrogenispora ethanolica]TCL58806.1 hypothetical protein EDC14_104020 [Hydrogenispora ethanolica]